MSVGVRLPSDTLGMFGVVDDAFEDASGCAGGSVAVGEVSVVEEICEGVEIDA